MEATTTLVSVTDLKRLLYAITQQEHPVSIRYRTLGQLWYPNFLSVVKIANTNVLFHDKAKKKLISLPDLTRIIQFELDGKFSSFEPNCHYQVADEHPSEQ